MPAKIPALNEDATKRILTAVKKTVDDEREPQSMPSIDTSTWFSSGGLVSAEHINHPKVTNDEREPVEAIGVTSEGDKALAATKGSFIGDTSFRIVELDDAVRQLCLSGVLHKTLDGKLIWRVGHLEHVANLYKSDPQQTKRDYLDDVRVAVSLTPDVWEGLVNG